MIKEMLKTAGVDNVDDFYKLHPTEEHFFKTYPHMKDKVKKGRKIRRAQKGGLMSNSLSRPSVPIDYHSQTAANKMHFADGGMHPNALRPASPAMNLDYRAGNYGAPKLRMQEGGDPQQEMMQQVMQMISGALQQGAEPKQIMQMLVQQGIPAEAAQQLMQAVMEQMQGGQEQYADGGKLPREVLRSRLESHMSPSEADEYLSTYAKGGIHIDPAKKGTFRAQATRMGMSVKEAARHIMANKENYSPAMVKKAVFAHNFAKQDGGYTYQEGGEAMPQEMMEAPQEQMQEQAMGQEQQQGGGQEQMMQQLAQMVAQALQQGMDPQQIVQMLVQQGVPQDVATQVVQMVMQQMGGGAPQGGPGQQYQPQGEQYQGPQPMAAYGGYYADGGFFNESYMPFDY